MRAGYFLIALTLAVSTASYADSSTNSERDRALKGINACLNQKEPYSRQCKSLKKNVATLEDLYRQGDKTVLPTLLKCTYLGDYFGEKVIADPNTFLTEVSELSEPDQQSVADSIAGGSFGLARPRFEAIRSALMTVPDSSPNYRLARKCLATLETFNAPLLVRYFPPQTFSGSAAQSRVNWLSRALYAMDEKPLWPPNSSDESTYRLTVMGGYIFAESITLTILPDGTGHLRYRRTDVLHHHLDAESTNEIGSQQVADFTASLNRTEFWAMPTELPPSKNSYDLDGADWILEGAQGDKYHIVFRWCPGGTPFGELGRSLFDFAGHKRGGNC